MNAALAAMSSSPILDLLVTLVAYQIGLWAYARWRQHPLLLPVFLGLLLVIAWNLATGRELAQYQQGSAALAVLLGPVTVALAVPLYQRLSHIRALLGPIVLTWLLTAAVVTASVLALTHLATTSPAVEMALLPKAATTPIAILIADSIGGIPAIAAITVMLTGIFGAMVGPGLLRRCGIHDDATIGFALGLSAHAVGTARAFDISPRCGAFAALGMSLMGGLLAVALPVIFG